MQWLIHEFSFTTPSLQLILLNKGLQSTLQVTRLLNSGLISLITKVYLQGWEIFSHLKASSQWAHTHLSRNCFVCQPLYLQTRAQSRAMVD